MTSLSTLDLSTILRNRGVSLYSFAKRHGYVYRTVCITVQRWGHRTDRTPHGGLARQIMADLKAELFSQDGE